MATCASGRRTRTRRRVAWPDGWALDVDRFRSGIDLTTDELLPGELELICPWYRRVVGDVPSHVELTARLAPSAYKTQRARGSRRP